MIMMHKRNETITVRFSKSFKMHFEASGITLWSDKLHVCMRKSKMMYDTRW